MEELNLSPEQLNLIKSYQLKIKEIDDALAKIPRNPNIDSEDLLLRKRAYEEEIDNIVLGKQQVVPTPTGNITAPEITSDTAPSETPFLTNEGTAYGYTDEGGLVIEVSGGTNRPLEDDDDAPTEPIPLYPALPNELHQYPSYTYGLSLHLLTPNEYNEIVKNQNFKPTRVLVASAGRKNADTFPRASNFSEDFYFENLEMETVIGLNELTRNTNAIRVSFTIIEPYGLTLLNRIITQVTELEQESYLDIPYLLEIDFYANNDAGETVGKLSNLTKRIPIKLAKMEVRAGVSGSEYIIEAFPFNHSAYDTTTVTTPENVEVLAGNVADFFASPIDISGNENSPRENNGELYKLTTGEYVGPDGQVIAASSLPTINVSKDTMNKLNSSTSYGAALTAYYLDLSRRNSISKPDKIHFQIDPEILKDGGGEFSLIGKDPKYNKMSDRASDAIRSSNLPSNVATNEFDLTQRVFAINAGTTIEKVISYVMRQSDYIQKQLVIPEDFGDSPAAYFQKLKEKENLSLNWFKIVPTIILGEWDPIRKMWQRTITYYVQKYEVKNAKLDIAPQGIAKYPIKEYNYLYTGKNVDIIDWTLQFNALYYNAVQVYKNAQTKISNLTDKSEETKNIKPGVGPLSPNAIQIMPSKPIVNNTRYTTNSGAVTTREMAVADLEESLLTMSDADMLKVDLKILGDPSFIKQDDVFYSPKFSSNNTNNQENPDDRLTTNQSIKTDSGEVYVKLIFRTPVDIDESTGLMRFEEKYKISVFSGLYKLVKVNSSFSKGAFTQVLELIRLPRQPEDVYESKVGKTSDDERKESNDISKLTDSNSVDAPSDSVVIPADAADGIKVEDTLTEGETLVDPEQEDLANVAASAETQQITDATAPDPIPPPPPPAPLLPEGVTTSPTSGLYQYGGVTIPPIKDSDLSAVTNAMATGQDITVYNIDPVSGKQRVITYSSSTNSFTQELE